VRVIPSVGTLLGIFGWLLSSVVVLWLATVGLVMYAGARPQLHSADAILVLGAAQYNGKPSPVLKARLDHALDLYDRGLAKRLVLTGGVGAGDTLSEGEVGRRYAMAHGVAETAILVERRGASSAESVAAAAALMRAHGLQRALIVSDPYHMLRLELLARRAGLMPLRAPTPRSPRERDAEQRWKFVMRESAIYPATALLGGR
jgi:uncharacterized SAM-binding protein YcdF (DUF218 family)